MGPDVHRAETPATWRTSREIHFVFRKEASVAACGPQERVRLRRLIVRGGSRVLCYAVGRNSGRLPFRVGRDRSFCVT